LYRLVQDFDLTPPRRNGSVALHQSHHGVYSISHYSASGVVPFLAYQMGQAMNKAVGSGYCSATLGLLGLVAAHWLFQRAFCFPKY
jgi:hypothetical protein